MAAVDEAGIIATGELPGVGRSVSAALRVGEVLKPGRRIGLVAGEAAVVDAVGGAGVVKLARLA